MMVNLVDYSVAAFEFAPVSSALMCSAAMIEHPQVLMLMVFYHWPPNNHHTFPTVSLVHVPIDNLFVAVDMDYSRIVGSMCKKYL